VSNTLLVEVFKSVDQLMKEGSSEGFRSNIVVVKTDVREVAVRCKFVEDVGDISLFIVALDSSATVSLDTTDDIVMVKVEESGFVCKKVKLRI